MIKIMQMLQKKFLHVIDAFACDFDLAIGNKNILLNINNKIQNKNKQILQDIDILSALSFYMRHGKIRLIKEEISNE